MRFREVLVLRELEGLSYRELADRWTCPLGTVMSSLSRARRAFHEALNHQLTATGSAPKEPLREPETDGALV